MQDCRECMFEILTSTFQGEATFGPLLKKYPGQVHSRSHKHQSRWALNILRGSKWFDCTWEQEDNKEPMTPTLQTFIQANSSMPRNISNDLGSVEFSLFFTLLCYLIKTFPTVNANTRESFSGSKHYHFLLALRKINWDSYWLPCCWVNLGTNNKGLQMVHNDMVVKRR